MVESSKNVTSIFPFPRIPSRLGTAVFVQYLGLKHRVLPLMRRLSKTSAQYAEDNEHMLDKFWLIGMPVKFSKGWLGRRPSEAPGSKKLH